MKKLSYTEMQEKFAKLSWKNQVLILHGALDYMQQYNGRTRLECIALAMGYVMDYDENNQHIFIKRS